MFETVYSTAEDARRASEDAMAGCDFSSKDVGVLRVHCCWNGDPHGLEDCSCRGKSSTATHIRSQHPIQSPGAISVVVALRPCRAQMTVTMPVASRVSFASCSEGCATIQNNSINVPPQAKDWDAESSYGTMHATLEATRQSRRIRMVPHAARSDACELSRPMSMERRHASRTSGKRELRSGKSAQRETLCRAYRAETRSRVLRADRSVEKYK